MFLIPISISSSRFLNSLLSQTLTALKFLLSFCPILTPSGLYPSAPYGEVPAVPIHFDPPSCLFSCSSKRFFNSSISFSHPPMDSICFFSSSVRYFSLRSCNHSSGISAVSNSSMFSNPLNTLPKTLSNLSKFFSSLTKVDLDK